MKTFPAETPEPPYYAVIFTNQRTASDPEEYARVAERMQELARAVPGFLGVESVRAEEGRGCTISYWESEDAIARWRGHAEHQEAQRMGRERFYAAFTVRIAKVDRAYTFARA